MLNGYTLEDLELVKDVHVYMVGGSLELPSVTHIMRRFGLGFQGIAPQSALWRGTWVHEATTLIDANDFAWDRCPEEYRGYCDAWPKAVRELGVEVVVAEWRSFHRQFGYAGTCDRIVRTSEDDGRRLAVLEIKTGDTQDWQVQAAAYGSLWEHWQGERPSLAILVKLNDDGTYRHEECSLEEPWRVFVALLQLYHWLEQTGRTTAVLR